ncbi:MAG: hypothetical protein ACXADH_17635 [Candidatus Kariarchaeaceae archaeon]|jgi:hypothetical protein
MENWTIRSVNDVSIVRVEGEDYVEVPGTTENYPAAYPDEVANAVLERKDNKIKVVLGHIRYFVTEDGITENKTSPQTVWLQRVDNKTIVADDSESNNDDGYITG